MKGIVYEKASELLSKKILELDILLYYEPEILPSKEIIPFLKNIKRVYIKELELLNLVLLNTDSKKIIEQKAYLKRQIKKIKVKNLNKLNVFRYLTLTFKDESELNSFDLRILKTFKNFTV